MHQIFSIERLKCNSGPTCYWYVTGNEKRSDYVVSRTVKVKLNSRAEQPARARAGLRARLFALGADDPLLPGSLSGRSTS